MRNRLSAVFAAVGLLWLVWLVDLIWPGSLSILGYGIVPRTTFGLRGIVVAPLIHANLQHLIANTIPLLILASSSSSSSSSTAKLKSEVMPLSISG